MSFEEYPMWLPFLVVVLMGLALLLRSKVGPLLTSLVPIGGP